MNSRHREIFQKLLMLHAQGFDELYVVGGYVRDWLLENPLQDSDIDLISPYPAPDLAQSASSIFGGTVKKFPEFFTAKLVLTEKSDCIEEIDFAQFRNEIYDHPGSLPRVVPGTMEQDLKRRDFSINAIALSIRHLLDGKTDFCTDPCGGKDDLLRRSIRILHEKSFIDDPTRLYRAIRYEMRIGGSRESRTRELFSQAIKSGVLGTISIFRVFTEIRKMCIEAYALEGLHRFYTEGLLAPLERYPAPVSTILSSLKASDNVYNEFLTVLYRALPESRALQLAQDLNVSKKEVLLIRAQ